MGYLIDDKSLINNNIFKYEERLGSQYAIYLDTKPTFVTYYHINNIDSTVDKGLNNVEHVLGRKSPIRFQEINDFPIYGIDTIQLDLNENDGVLDTMYEGDGVILPNTIKPDPGDMFTISYLNQNYLFMVTSIAYDTIKSNNFYKISFYLRSMNEESIHLLQNQIEEVYNCIFKNIGTEDKCLLRSDDGECLSALDEIYNSMLDKYKTLFYSQKYNSFLYTEGELLWYDKYLTHFINNNQLLSKKNQYATVMLSNEDEHYTFIPEYERSFYKAVEDNDINEVTTYRCIRNNITYTGSIFKYYHLPNVRSVSFIDTGNIEYIPDSFIYKIKSGIIDNEVDAVETAIISYFNNIYTCIQDIDITSLKKHKIRYTYKDFILTPIVLFILKHYTSTFMSN